MNKKGKNIKKVNLTLCSLIADSTIPELWAPSNHVLIFNANDTYNSMIAEGLSVSDDPVCLHSLDVNGTMRGSGILTYLHICMQPYLHHAEWEKI